MYKIFFDTAPLVSGHAARGMGVYTKRLLEGLERDLKKSNSLKLVKRSAEYELVHYPYFDLFYHSLPLNKLTKRVVTVPDVIPLLYPENYPPGIKGKINYYLQKLALLNSDAIITISETSKKDIVRFLGVPSEKVFVTKLAANFKVKKVNSRNLRKIKTKYKLPDEFILYVGDVNWNKNIIRLIKAVKKIEKTLVIVGKNATRTDYDKEHIENAPLREIQEKYGSDKKIIRLGFVEDSDLNAIWQLATVYCMPSLYEGFGLSVVEAMSAGVPVVCAKTQALVEVAGGGALYFNPHSVDDIAQKIDSILESSVLQKKLILEGRKQAKKYSWQKTARETIEVYKLILET